jgi:hypothetical protein
MSFFRRTVRAVTLHRYRKAWKAKSALLDALREISRFPKHPDAPRHRLPSSLVVSLTSYPARFKTLHLTIKSLLDQTVKPDCIVLWVDHGAMASLPQSITELEGPDFSVRPTDDLRSFTKIIPALIAFPESFIVVADDDNYYPENWLRELVDAYDPALPAIVYQRGHRLAYLPNGRLAPYRSWQREVRDSPSLLPSIDVMPTGVGGVLYPPGSLPARTVDVALFRRLSETCDDSWLYFMWRQNGWKARRAPAAKSKLVTWPQTQEQSLMSFHLGGKKDEHLQALSDYFGTP